MNVPSLPKVDNSAGVDGDDERRWYVVVLKFAKAAPAVLTALATLVAALTTLVALLLK
jgi:hypothetical protein